MTRYSGRRLAAPPVPDRITERSYHYEAFTCGFWPGDDLFPYPAFYAFAAPEPQGYAQARLRPAAAFYAPSRGQFLLRYDEVRQASDPAQMLADFVRSSYEAAAILGRWDRAALEY